ncbi:TRAFs-binding domain-containing protein [Sphingobium scionense]
MILPILAQIRRVARSGDTVRAWTMFGAAGLLQSRDADALTLKGRLLKDQALRSESAERSALLDEAQQAYLQAASGCRATYPLINAATLALLNDQPADAVELARQVLALLDSGDHVQETRYWLAATAAEAHLLLGNEAASQTALMQAMTAAPNAWEDHAATLRQFHEILTWQGRSTAILDPLRPPPSLYFSGIIGLPENEREAREKIETALDQIAPGAAFGALAAGADILIAECALARGIQLHIVLPTTLDVFRQTSVGQFGDRWFTRFDRLIEMADSLEAPDAIPTLSNAAIDKGSEIAMGLALRRAEAFATQAIALHVTAPQICLPLPIGCGNHAHCPYTVSSSNNRSLPWRCAAHSRQQGCPGIDNTPRANHVGKRQWPAFPGFRRCGDCHAPGQPDPEGLAGPWAGTGISNGHAERSA